MYLVRLQHIWTNSPKSQISVMQKKFEKQQILKTKAENIYLLVLINWLKLIWIVAD